MAISLSKVEQVRSHKWMWTTVGHRWGYKSAGDVFCLYRRYRTEKGEEEKRRRRSKKLQRSACYKRSPVKQTPSSRMTWDLKGTEEGKEGQEGDSEGTMPKVTRKNVVRRATKTNRLSLSVSPWKTIDILCNSFLLAIERI